VSSNVKKLIGLLFVIAMSYSHVTAQISPGDLSDAHAHLEGISNCTQCHVLGNKVSDEKCLTCHSEIKERLTQQQGFHNSEEVKSKSCTVCHSDHHGKKFQMIRFDESKFDHTLTGFKLSVPHQKRECNDCHNTKFITNQKLKNKSYTYLGLGTECLTCHEDYHQKTLSSDCLSCHNPDAFKPANKFDHNQTKFALSGKHSSLDCLNCHKIQTGAGKKFQDFRINQFNCSNCHRDPHQDKFGQNCSECHNETSFAIVRGANKFDHNKTNFRLEDKHLAVNCKLCHKTKFTDPLKFKLCTDCHNDYHEGQFAEKEISPDCSKCHTTKGFSLFSYTLEQHNLSSFPLQGAHVATACIDCHKKQKDWSFKGIGRNCKDCHNDIHKNLIDEKYYPGEECKMCHNTGSWGDIRFDHSKTVFSLTGVHGNQKCEACHLINGSDGIGHEKFSGLSTNCSSCHLDKHFKQFEKNGITDCVECHDTENWKASKFDHNNTDFKLDGKHVNVPCVKCHKPQQEGSNFYVKYKLKVFTCESCHS
jgi:hypothetical protein